MITLEKLLLVKSIPFFQQTPDELLLQIATTAMKEQRVMADELIIQKNDVGTDMYVIVSGRVKIHEGEKLITTLGEREIFGELSALTLEPRVSSVSAITECLLLKINGLALYEIMHFDVGLAKGIIHALCDRARLMSAQIQVLMSKE